MIAAASGRISEARLLAERAREQPGGVERSFCSDIGDTIANGVDGDDGFDAQIVAVTQQCRTAEYIDGLVLAFRVYPRTLQGLAEEPRAISLVRTVLAGSRDFAIARRAGIEIKASPDEDPFGALTAREHEVLGLLLEGLANAEIASRLHITESTAKVHVRHIFEKLGVRSRLQAVIRAQEIVESSAP